LYQRAGDSEAMNRFHVERADIRQNQLSLVGELTARGSYRLAIQLANRRHVVIKKRLDRRGWSYSESDQQLMEEQHLLDELTIQCRAELAEKSGAWDKASTLWRRIGQKDRATIAQTKAIDAIADPIARGYALLKAGEYERARGSFESAAYNKGIVQTEALVCEKNKDWKKAADLWQSLGDNVRYATAMAHTAAYREDWPEAARWYRLAGHRGLAADAERAARKTLRRTQAALF
jgi:tetratricopeptide (TPR) repeat protein